MALNWEELLRGVCINSLGEGRCTSELCYQKKKPNTSCISGFGEDPIIKESSLGNSLSEPCNGFSRRSKAKPE